MLTVLDFFKLETLEKKIIMKILYSNSELLIREALPEDVELILDFIKSLAEYEKLLNEVTATPELIHKSLFGDKKNAECILAFYNEIPAAFAVYFFNYSTFKAKPGLYLEDLFVKPEFRKRGIGKKMLALLAKIAIENDCSRFEWSVLDWNVHAIEFYLSLGAFPLSDWTTFRMTNEEIKKLAAQITG